MRFRHLLQAALVTGALALAGTSFAQPPHQFIEQGQVNVTTLLKQPQNDARDTQSPRLQRGTGAGRPVSCV